MALPLLGRDFGAGAPGQPANPSPSANTAPSTLTGGVTSPTIPHGLTVNPTQGTPTTPPASAPNAATPAQPAQSANLLDGLVATPDPTSPTGGTVTQAPTAAPINQSLIGQVGTGIDTSANSLLPQSFSPADLNVPQQNQTPPSVDNLIAADRANQVGMTSWNVTPNETVAGQYAQLMSAGNPAIQAAEQQTLRNFGAAGGASDLMAQNAAAMSGSQVALTIAAQDAQTYARAGEFNAAAANTFAQQLNQFTDNAMLSKQNFDNAIATLGAQTNQYMVQLAAQINAHAATSSIDLNTAIKESQAGTQSTLISMSQQYANSEGLANFNASIASAQSLQAYSQQIRLGYLSSISQQQAAMQNTIGAIESNPNITQTQATGAVSDAINEFNTFVTQIGAYSAAMIPTKAPTAPPVTTAGAPVDHVTASADLYNSDPSTVYNYINPSFPNATYTLAPAAPPRQEPSAFAPAGIRAA